MPRLLQCPNRASSHTQVPTRTAAQPLNGSIVISAPIVVPPAPGSERLCHVGWQVLCLGVAIGHVEMADKELYVNSQMSINFLVSLLKKNWQNVKVRVGSGVFPGHVCQHIPGGVHLHTLLADIRMAKHVGRRVYAKWLPTQ